MRRKNLKLDLALGDDLPLVAAKESVLRQLVVSLLDNACRASAEGTAVVVSAAAATTNGSQATAGRVVALAFSDTGGGVAAAERERVFGTQPNLGGRPIGGLGDSGGNLAIVQKLAQAGGGDVVFESTPGVGTTFTLRLPAAEVRPWSLLAPAPDAPAPSPPTPQPAEGAES